LIFGACFAIAIVVVLFPTYWIVISAITPQSVLFSPGFNFLPLHLTLANFREGFAVVPVLTYFWHSVVLATVPACLSSLVAVPAAYSFGRLRFFGRGPILGLVVFTGFLPIMCSVIPLFELFKYLDLIGTWWVMFTVYTAFELGFTTWILTLFVSRIPRELEEAARIDGARDREVFRWLIGPLLAPALASLFIVNFLAAWNQFLLPTIFSTGNSTAPLVLGIAQAAENPALQSVAWGAEAAFGLVVVVPAVLVVLIFQRRIAEGLTAGAIKG
jgi:trehalose/maltose transport system permease protein